MKKYTTYQLSDFIIDDEFIEWVLHPNKDSDNKWNDWLIQHPEKSQLIESARSTIIGLNVVQKEEINKEDLNDIWNSINISTNKSQSKSIGLWKYIGVAASVLILIFSYSYITSIAANNSSFQDTIEKDQYVTYQNDTEQVKRIELEDGSYVTLEPNAKFEYPVFFEGDKRIVKLDGVAFFDIERDEKRPFFVYTQDAIVKVLGTSFTVKANNSGQDLEVIVKTGKVAVFNKDDFANVRTVESQEIKPLLVTPNQKVVLDKKSRKMSRRIISVPSLVIPLRNISKTRFRNSSLGEILISLEQAYKIKINIDSEEALNCKLTTTLTNQSLFEKLDIICEPLSLRYEERDAQIYIYGNCK